MDVVITYDTVKTLVAHPSSLGNRPNFSNLPTLHIHFARALQRVPYPQSTINIWSGMVLMLDMYTLISTKPFTNEMELKKLVTTSLQSLRATTQQ
jgi:hypothetical protein